jgi:uncharacterized protein (TIGR03435 family)
LTPTILLITAASIALACPMLLAQTTPTPPAASSTAIGVPPAPSFDVATIKPHSDVAKPSFIGIKPTPDGVYAVSVPLANLVIAAYGHQRGDQVSGVPEWAKTARFDVQAKMSDADSAEMQNLNTAEANARRKLMMQALLAERFKLKVHSEAGRAPVYELIVAKGGPKLGTAATNTSDDLHGTPKTGIMFRNGIGVARGESMESLARFLSSPNAGMERPVIDKTGLTSTYYFTLNSSGCTRLPCQPDDATSMFSALQEFGLKLQPATGPIEIIVIDHAEYPTGN